MWWAARCPPALVARTQARLGPQRHRSSSGWRWRIALGAAVRLRRLARATSGCCASPRVVAGYYTANASLYRFAAAELAAPAAREKAVSLVMAGGLLGAVLGPNLAARTRDLFSRAVRRRLPRAGRRGAAGHGAAGLHAVSARARAQRRRSGGRPLRRDHAPAGLHRRRRVRARSASA